MKKYDSYKDSGIEWIGEIPENWSVKKTFHFFKAEKGKKAAQLTKEFCGTIEGIYPVYSGQTENNGIMSSINEYEFNFSDDGCLLSTTVGAKAMSINFIQGKFSLSQNCMVITSRNKSEILNKFFFYQFQPIFNFHRNLIPDHMQPSFRMDDLYQFKIIIPSKEEQNAIANYLDHKTSIIEDLIGKKERLIELLEEERTAVINQAVTKGLDPSIPMKDSGIEWLGEIPEHWDKPRMKFICEFILDGTHGSFQRVDEGFRLLSVRNIINNKFVLRDDDSMVSLEDFEVISKRFLIQKNDIQLAIVGATLGKVAIVDDLPEKIVTQRSLATIRLNDKLCNPHFLYCFLLSEKFQTYLWLNAGFSAQPGVYLGTLQNCSIPLPDLKTQNQIIDFISEKSKTFDIVISKSNQEIELLKEYKSALISAVVTGKVDVSTSSTQVLESKN
jgi:type I restriction enzyme S subunit